jgi:hypothetical protein
MNRLPRLLLVSTLALLACKAEVKGNGELGHEHRTVAPFDEVEISLGFEAAITANAAAQDLELSGDSNLLPFILTPVEAGVLETRLHLVASIDPINPLQLSARATALRRVKATEASIVEVTGAGSTDDGFSLVVEAAGQSNVHLAGPGGHRLQVILAGASALDASSYPVAVAEVQLTGLASLRVNSATDVTGSADRSTVVVTGGGGCAALRLTGGATCQAP